MRKGTEMGYQQGAIMMTWEDGTTGFVILPIHEHRNSGPVFRLQTEEGAHLLSAADVRGSWDAWVKDLVREDQIVDFVELPNYMEIY